MKFKKILLFIIVIIIAYFGTKYCVKQYVFPYKYTEYINEYSEEFDLDPLFVLSIIKTESNFNEDAVSHREAKGLMQVMDTTGEWAARELGIEGFEPNMLLDPKTNIQIGCWYLDNLRSEFGDLDLVIAAYNGGSGNVNKWLSDEEYSIDGESLHYIPFPETKKYVDKVKTNYEIYKFIYEKKH
ncbi:lytic transglycosylase domain-containing protein [Clostridium sp.]|uniref:lytic transglycosylase domain-containing protein n=1 Tax=Clostridium sp. TaxID=1506 RepID=UPI003F2FEA08